MKTGDYCIYGNANVTVTDERFYKILNAVKQNTMLEANIFKLVANAIRTFNNVSDDDEIIGICKTLVEKYVNAVNRVNQKMISDNYKTEGGRVILGNSKNYVANTTAPSQKVSFNDSLYEEIVGTKIGTKRASLVVNVNRSRRDPKSHATFVARSQTIASTVRERFVDAMKAYDSGATKVDPEETVLYILNKYTEKYNSTYGTDFKTYMSKPRMSHWLR